MTEPVPPAGPVVPSTPEDGDRATRQRRLKPFLMLGLLLLAAVLLLLGALSATDVLPWGPAIDLVGRDVGIEPQPQGGLCPWPA